MSTFLLPHEPITTLEAYLGTETGGAGIAAARRLGPAATIETITAAGLRGRGGGGFPTGRKWAGIAGQTGDAALPGLQRRRRRARHVQGPGAAAGEPVPGGRGPGRSPGFAIGAAEAYIGIKARFEREIDAFTRAVQEFQAAGLCGDCTVNVVAGPDEYLFGEEKAMLEVIEGKPPLPRWFPPYEHGLFAASPQLGWEAGPHGPGDRHRRAEPDARQQRRDARQRAAHPRPRCGVVPLDGHRGVARHRRSPPSSATSIAPDVGEVELGTPLRAVIDAVGSGVGAGPRGQGGVLRRRQPGGDRRAARRAGQLRGPRRDRQRHGVGRLHRLRRHRLHGRCRRTGSPGSSRSSRADSARRARSAPARSRRCSSRIETGVGTDDDIGAIGGWLERVTDGSRCYLAVEEQQVIGSMLRAFPEEFVEHLEQASLPTAAAAVRSRSSSISSTDGRPTTRPTWRKRPDWTYDPA